MEKTLVILFLLTGLAGCQQQKESSARRAKDEARKIGAASALQSIERGDPLVLKEYPPRPYPPGHNIYTDLLKERCQVQWKLVQPGELPEQDFIQQVQGWNVVIEEEIRNRHGATIMEDLSSESQRLFKQQRADPGLPSP
jgi:hypothetical protein